MTVLTRGLVRHTRPPSPHFARTDPLDRGLVGEWRFDRDTGLVVPDYSGNANTGEITPGNGGWVSTEYGPAYKFDGAASYVLLGTNVEPIHSTLQGSFECFFRTDELTDVTALFGAADTTAADPYMSFNVRQNNIRVIARSGLTGLDIIDTNTGIISSTSAWYHLVVTGNGDGTQWIIYVNGISQGGAVAVGGNNGVWFGDLSADTYKYTIGDRDNTDGHRWYDGDIGGASDGHI